MSPFAGWQHELGRLFDDLLNDFDVQPFDGRRAFPGLNLWEDGDTLYAEAEVPGLRLDDLEILVNGNELTVKGQHQADADDKRVFHRRERARGAFARVLTLPFEIDSDKVEAALRDGVLTMKLPKAASARARKIVVKSA